MQIKCPNCDCTIATVTTITRIKTYANTKDDVTPKVIDLVNGYIERCKYSTTPRNFTDDYNYINRCNLSISIVARKLANLGIVSKVKRENNSVYRIYIFPENPLDT